MGSRGTIDAAKVAELERQLAASEAARIAAEARLAASEEARSRSEEALARLERMIAQLRRDKFGSRSEKTSTDQQHLPFEDVEIAEGMLAAASEEVEKALGNRRQNPRARNGNKGHLPAHLERIEQVLEPDSTSCPCGCGEMVRVGVVP